MSEPIFLDGLWVFIIQIHLILAKCLDTIDSQHLDSKARLAEI